MQTTEFGYGGIQTGTKHKKNFEKMCGDAIEVIDTSCLIVSHDTQNEEAVPTDDLVYEYLDYND